MAKRLTAAKVAAETKPGLHGDGGGLYLQVAKGGSKSWIRIATVNGKRRKMGLGGYPAVSLADARGRADENRRAVAAGRDPLAEKREAARKAETPTFEAAASAYHAANLPRWRCSRHGKQWLAGLERHAFPKIGGKPVDEIGCGDVLDIVSPMWTATPEIARKLRQRIRAVFKWAQAHGYIEHNPAGEAIDGALPAMPAVKQHLKALPYRDVSDALARIEASQAWPMTKACLRFIVLTACRGGEARGATWDEIDLDAATWTIPGERMKMGREHRVPLSPAALAVLEGCKAFRGRQVPAARERRQNSPLVFPSSRAGRIGDSTLQKLLRANGIDCVPHGFRSSFRDWCAETGKPRELAEAALAHIVGGVEGAYFRSDLFEARRRLMADWTAFLAGESAKVVRLHG